MAKTKERSEVEALRSENRALKKEVSTLKRALGRLEKRGRQVEELEDLFQDLVTDQQEIIEKRNQCSCGGNIEKFDLGVRTLLKCVSCGKRETKKK